MGFYGFGFVGGWVGELALCCFGGFFGGFWGFCWFVMQRK